MKLNNVNKKPAISIIVANYNNDIYLDDCLKSVVSQSFTDFECIVVDDGSTDGSVNVIKRWAKQDKRIIPVFQKNHGVSHARNVGINMARGRWIGFLDADDCFCADGLKILYECGEQNNVDIVGGGGVRVPDDFQLKDAPTEGFVNPPFFILGFNVQDVIKMELLGETHRFVWVWRRLFRREILQDVRFDEELYPGEDTCFMYEVLPRVRRIAECKAMVVYHRVARRAVSAAPYNQKTFAWIPPTLRRLRRIMDAFYPKVYQKHFYKNYLELIIYDVIIGTVTRGRLMSVGAKVLKEVYGTDAFPIKYLPWYKRLIVWLFVKIFG
ncbi:MAG: glycosyltransferase family 2 protein [Alphaproteobacteria bacterium]|nr:glycosyltransferase family 2 protein [Alphaproteobacteria bacterium]